MFLPHCVSLSCDHDSATPFLRLSISTTIIATIMVTVMIIEFYELGSGDKHNLIVPSDAT